MPIEVLCTSCSKKLRVPDTAAGKKIKCPKCTAILAVPAANGDGEGIQSTPPLPEPVMEMATAAPAPSRRRRDEDDDRPSRRRRDEDDDDRPRRRGPRRDAHENEPSGTAQLVMGIISIVVAVLAIPLAFMGCCPPIAFIAAGMAGLGLLLGGGGTVMALVQKRGLVCPVIGTAISVLALIIVLAWALFWAKAVTDTNKNYNNINQFQQNMNKQLEEQNRRMLEEKKKKDAAWSDQWERGKIYEVPEGGGLTLTSRLTVNDDRNKVAAGVYEKVFQVQMNAGKQYTIRLNARDFSMDPMLRLDDAAGKQLAINDDAPGEGTLNSRIDFLCTKDGVYRVVATHLGPRLGDFTLIITKKDGKVIGKEPEADAPPVLTVPRFTLAQTKGIQDIALSPSGSLLSWCNFLDNRFRLWDVKANQVKADMAPGVGTQMTAVAFSTDGKTVAVGGNKGTIKLWDVEKLEAKTLNAHTTTVQDLIFLSGNKLMSGSYDKTIKIWDLETSMATKTVMMPIVPQRLRCSADGRLAAVFDGVTGLPRLWNMETGTEHTTKLPPGPRINCLALSPNGKTLATGALNGDIVLWDTESGAQRTTLIGHKNMLGTVRFSADGKMLASAASDKMARVWDVETGKTRAVFMGAGSLVALSADGSVLVAGSNAGGTITVWDVPPAK